jgi:hypothetical protein
MTALSARPDDRYRPPPEPAPRASWLRVEIHFSSLLLFYGTVYGLLGVVMLFSTEYANEPLLRKVILALPFIIGPFAVSGIGWLQLLLLGWITRKLGDMA